jgi:hypothetical protein
MAAYSIEGIPFAPPGYGWQEENQMFTCYSGMMSFRIDKIPDNFAHSRDAFMASIEVLNVDRDMSFTEASIVSWINEVAKHADDVPFAVQRAAHYMSTQLTSLIH